MDESDRERVLLWMVSGMSGTALESAVVGKFEIEPDEAKAIIADARRRLTLAAEYNRDEMIGTALARLNDLYGRCIREQGDPQSNAQSDRQNKMMALNVQREINRLAGLYEKPGADRASSDVDDSAAEELEAVAGHLLTLKLAGKVYPLREHARLAVQRIVLLTAKLDEKGKSAK